MEHTDAVENSDLIDPLVDYSSFSFNSFSSTLFRPLVNPNFGSPVSHLKYMVLRNPDLLVSQAKTIRDGSMDLLESNEIMTNVSEEKSEAPFTVNDKNNQERRPALGLKRAKFSAKPMPSQPDVSLEPRLDIDKLKEPEEFFAAFERIENAKKELQRQKGQPLIEMDQNRSSLLPRRRRPSLLGKSATYKHRSYSLAGVPDNDEALMSSQEAYDHSIMSPTREDAIPESNAVKFSPIVKVSDVKPAMSSKVNELDELLSYDYEGLDEDGVQNLLQDKLNIKLVDVGEPSLPDMPVVRRREYGSLVEALPNMKDSICHVNDSSKAASSNPLNFGYQFRKSSNSQVSPSLCKSPLASISTLNKHISRLTPLKDPFLPVDIDSSPEVISYQMAQNSKQTDQIGKMIDSRDFSRFPVNEEETDAAATSPGSAGNSKTPNNESEERLDGVSHGDHLVTSKDSHEFGRSPACTEEDIRVSGEKLPSVTSKDIAPIDDSEEWMDEIRQIAQAGTRENLLEIRSPTDGEDNLAVFGEGSLADAAKDVDTTSVPIEEDDQTDAGPEFVGKEVFSEGSAVEKAGVNEGDGEMDEPLNTQGILIENPNKKTVRSLKSRRTETEESTTSQENIYEETVNKRRKKKAKSIAAVLKQPKNKKRKEGPPALTANVDEKLRRLSLYEAGTKWEAGLRRSTRIRMRPLEFWRGERFLYGRVHQSMVSVIGVKYASPTKNMEEPSVKVKSFVSDEYKDLLDLASSH